MNRSNLLAPVRLAIDAHDTATLDGWMAADGRFLELERREALIKDAIVRDDRAAFNHAFVLEKENFSSMARHALTVALAHDRPALAHAILDRVGPLLDPWRANWLRLAADHRFEVKVDTLWDGSDNAVEEHRRQTFRTLAMTDHSALMPATHQLATVPDALVPEQPGHMVRSADQALMYGCWEALAVLLATPGFPPRSGYHDPAWPSFTVMLWANVDQHALEQPIAFQDRLLAQHGPDSLPELAQAQRARQRAEQLAQQSAPHVTRPRPRA